MTFDFPYQKLQSQSLIAFAKTLQINNGKVFDPLRKIWILAQPEELVRQSIILFFKQELQIPMEKMMTEYTYSYLNKIQRFDLVVFDDSFKPKVIVEAKAPQVKLSKEHWAQVNKYFISTQIEALWWCNGQQDTLFFNQNL